ncbi:Probable cobalt transporter subunit (CbtA) [Natronorubrum sediminis]|uniref:Probable cobalt transporter subunit (CbtA) n=1 Tax=Natronorubrum sediminis TaxID=640943 RepID=A0A1H6G4L1_9EURY|nr:CbtA family protein [Natronorubrum sediminis]SEH17989.1 Probable cobalt transporter subunit (CbtA) [Natronorubrum sediminis]
MIADYLQRGILAGVVAGLAYGMYMVLVGNPLGDYLHDAQHDHGHDHGHGHGDHGHEHAVSETTTAIVSAGSGVLWAIFLGGLFAIALYFLEPALPGSESVKAYVLAGAGFFAVSLSPWLVLPPAAPGAEQLYTINGRLAVYVGLIALGALVAAASIAAYKRGAPRHPVVGLLVAAVPIAAVVTIVPLATPTVITHPDLSGDLVSTYQALAALSQAAIWVLLAGTFNALRRRTAPTGETTASGSNDPLTANP